MEESVTSVDFLTYYKQCMKLEPVDANMYSPLVLAYIGDAVYELIIRSRVVNQGSMQVNKMHKRSAGLVKAGTQAALIRVIEDLLTEEEHAVYKRGRNAKSVTTAKNASVIDYRNATGLEALAGWLFLKERYDRLVYLVSQGLIRLGELPGGEAGRGGENRPGGEAGRIGEDEPDAEDETAAMDGQAAENKAAEDSAAADTMAGKETGDMT